MVVPGWSSFRTVPLLLLRAAATLLPLLALAPLAAADGRQTAAPELKKLSIEELMEIDVTLAARQAEPIGGTAAAISVITGEDIRRSGATTIADALRLADGVHVARVNNATWAITARGLAANSPNKLLVMIDGRTEYSPLFTGVFWNILDYPLEDIERIEVIRGPGATLWGANAVNGVVNIITRHTRATQGTYASVAAGNEDRLGAEVRHGGTWAAASWRLYGKYAHRDSQQFSTGTTAADDRRRGQAGFRLDGGSGTDAWLLKGDVFHSRDGMFDRRDAEWSHVGVQGRWSRTRPRTRLDLQSYYRREYRNVAQQLTHHVDTIDVDLQHALTASPRHQVVWGVGYRRDADRTDGTFAVAFDPAARVGHVSNLFLQDEVALLPGRVDLIAGLKVEHNTFSGTELQPNVRGRWRLPHRQMLWGAVARAVRRPTRVDEDIVVATPAGVPVIVGSDSFQPESLVASEVGYRVQPSAFFSADVTVFTHRYDQLRSQEFPVAGGPIVLGNTLDGESHGIETAVNLQPHGRWRTHVSYTWLDTDITPEAGSRDLTGGASEANDPHHLFALRTSLDLGRGVELDAMLRAVGALPNPRVPAYSELDLRLGWQATPRLELALVGHDLLQAQHPEFGTAIPRRVEFERGLRAVLTVRVP